jgi:hypothetical protein
MHVVFDDAVITDTSYLGTAPEITPDGRCTFPGCRRHRDQHIQFGPGERLDDLIELSQVVDPREYHRGDVGYYHDELVNLVNLTVKYVAEKLRPELADLATQVMVEEISYGLACRVFDSGYRRCA